MANQEQLDRLLEEGVPAWNEWRAENLDVQIDLSNADLFVADLRGTLQPHFRTEQEHSLKSG